MYIVVFLSHDKEIYSICKISMHLRFEDLNSKTEDTKGQFHINFICISCRYSPRIKVKQSFKPITSKKNLTPKDENRKKREILLADRDKYELFKEQDRMK